MTNHAVLFFQVFFLRVPRAERFCKKYNETNAVNLNFSVQNCST